MYIQRRRIVSEKLMRLQNGLSAYVETNEVRELLKKEIAQLNLPIEEDVTDYGYWFVPKNLTKHADELSTR